MTTSGQTRDRRSVSQRFFFLDVDERHQRLEALHEVTGGDGGEDGSLNAGGRLKSGKHITTKNQDISDLHRSIIDMMDVDAKIGKGSGTVKFS